MGHATYLVINLASVAVPFIASFHPRLRFDRRWFAFWPACLLTAAFFVAWDVLYTHWGVWSFADRYTLGIKVFNLPLEELMFFVCIPYASVFTYHCLNVLGVRSPSATATRTISWSLIALLSVVALLHPQHLYTSVTFTLCALMLVYLVLSKASWLGSFLRSYVVVLIPFFIVNGLLTGSMLDEAVVRYDDTQNLGIRLGTIPVEDVFYGMLMLLMSTSIYEYLVARRVGKEHQAGAQQA